MAIVLEEDRSKVGASLINVALWLVFIVVLAIGTYYLFKKPEIIEIALPDNVKESQQIADFKINPEEVLRNDEFKALRPYVTIPSLPRVGHPNPFMPR
jgi:hypothetical protein